jgi:hypothetical protein
VFSDGKVDRDAGELCGAPHVGVAATMNVDHLLSLKADCVCYTASDLHGIEHVIDEICQILRSGTNVVNCSITALAYPPLMPKEIAQIDEACKAGQSSFYYGGMNPGFGADLLPALASSFSRNISGVEMWEYYDPATYPTADLVRMIGFGLTPAQDKESVSVEMMAPYWTPGPSLVADALGVKIEDMTMSREVHLAEEEFTRGPFNIKAGTIDAMHVRLGFLVNGTERITYHELMRIAPAPNSPPLDDWPDLPVGRGGYKIIIHGTPTVTVDMSCEPGEDGRRWGPKDGFGGLMISSGVRLVNAIPTVCEAAPGIYTSISLDRPVYGSVNW